MRRNYRRWKRAVDLLILLIVVVPAAVLGAVVATAVWLLLGRPVLFRQVRPGLRGRPFVLVKFRTMRRGAGLGGSPESDEARLTPFGRWLRSTSLDELPELWNVLRGEMSFVGPRPLLMEYLPLYDGEQARRMEMLPGITGWAQVKGRNDLPWPERLRLDVWYVDHASLGLDLKILVLTVGAVLSRRGVSHPGHSTMERFRGNV